MKIVFIRHGECDKSGADERGFIGLGRDLAPLTARGIEQAQAAAESPLLSGCQLILSSPYTRALQTAAIIAGRTGLELRVELDLHELIPDKTFQVRGEAEAVALHEDFKRCHGVCPPGENRRWETLEELVRRTRPVLDRLSAMKKSPSWPTAASSGAIPASRSSATVTCRKWCTRRISAATAGYCRRYTASPCHPGRMAWGCGVFAVSGARRG